jgi:hypothetical protein
MEILWWLGVQAISVVWTLLSWILLQLFWLLLWMALPICVAAILCVLAAERFVGKERVRIWLRQQFLSLARRSWRRLRRALFAFWAVPLRVANWFVIFALWYAVLSLLRTPRWTPWQRAWRCRWGHGVHVRAA